MIMKYAFSYPILHFQSHRSPPTGRGPILESRHRRLERHRHRVQLHLLRRMLHGPQARRRARVPRVAAHPAGRRGRQAAHMAQFPVWEALGSDDVGYEAV